MPLLLKYNQRNYSGWFPLRYTVAQPELTFLVRAVSALLQPLGYCLCWQQLRVKGVGW